MGLDLESEVSEDPGAWFWFWAATRARQRERTAVIDHQ